MSIRAGVRSALDFLKSNILQVNLFNTGTQNEDIARDERRSTRLYLVLLIVSMSIIISYYSIKSYPQTIVIQSPTINRYYSLVQEPSLECPCSTIAIKYGQFIQIEPHYHELCQSDFVSDEWIKKLLVLYQESVNKSVTIDFRRTAVFQFQTIRSLCQLAENAINESLESFQYSDFIQPQLISQEIFQDQIGSSVTNFIDMLPKTFLRTLDFAQDIVAQSLFMTGAAVTSVLPIEQYRVAIDKGIIPYVGMNYTFPDGSTCICSTSTATSCMSLVIFEERIVPGFHAGCYMLSALKNSTLEAFYNQSFIDILSSSSNMFRKLNSSNPNWSIELLLSQMFVNFWSNTTSFENLFQNCAPNLCQYTINHRDGLLTIIILLISLCGGLSAAFRILAPILIVNIWPVILRAICRRQPQTTSVIEVESVSGNFTTDYRIVNVQVTFTDDRFAYS